jgi:hypothetical protein
MANVFLCPTCGAPLDPHGSIDTIRCPYCNNSVIVPPELRAPSFGAAELHSPLQFDLSGVQRLQEVARLARAGQTEEAIAIFREITGVGETEARESVAAFKTGRPVVFSSTDASIMRKPGFEVLGHSGSKVVPVVSVMRGEGFQGVTLTESDEASTKRRGCGWVNCWWVFITLIILASVFIPLFGVGYSLFTQGALSGIAQSVNLGGFAHTTMSFGAKGTGPGYFTDPRTITVDPRTGNILVGEYDSGRIQAFSPAGKFLFQWQVNAKPKPYINGLSAGYNGKVYLAIANSPILLFDSATGKAAGQMKYKEITSYQSVFALPDGGLLAVANDEDIVRWDADGKITLEIPAAVSSVSDSSELIGRATANGVGDLYILGSFNFSVFHYSPKGKYISRFGGEGDAPGNLGLGTEAIAVDNKGRIFVSDSGHVKVFSPDGQYLDAISVSGAPFQITFDDNNYLYVITNKPEVVKMALNR